MSPNAKVVVVIRQKVIGVSDDDTNKTRLVARVPVDTAKRIKIAAVEDETTTSEVVRMAVEQWLERRNKLQNVSDGGSR